MKKIAFIILCVFALNANAQKDSLSSSKKIKMNAGFMLNPQGYVSLKDPATGFKLSMPFYALFSFSKEEWSATPIFSLSDNSFGGFIEYSFSKSAMYLVAIKSTETSGSYLGIGGGVPVASGKAQAFIESGSSWTKWDPYFYMGVSIPLTFRIK
jgi:hypothetical protein